MILIGSWSMTAPAWAGGPRKVSGGLTVEWDEYGPEDAELWEEINDVPSGLQLFRYDDPAEPLTMHVLVIDPSDASISVLPHLGLPKDVATFCDSVQAFACINGGYFGGRTSYSAVLTRHGLAARNVSGVTRFGQFYPVTRGFWGVDAEGLPVLTWVYHFGSSVRDMRGFEAPLPNVRGTPALAPPRDAGAVLPADLVGIGGGPVLLKDGAMMITYEEEVFWGSGIGALEDQNPRTAVGHRANGELVWLVVDGRQATSRGVSLMRLAEVMALWGAVDALNMDGGGSSAMAVKGRFASSPSQKRRVPSIWAVSVVP